VDNKQSWTHNEMQKGQPQPKLQWLSWKYTPWLFNIAMENGPFIDGLPIKNHHFQ